MTDPLLVWASRTQPATIQLLRSLVECESPSDSPTDVRRCQSLIADAVTDHADISFSGTVMTCKFRLPGKAGKSHRILALGHADTVWPLGTLKTMKFRRTEGRLWGPGILDMKAGLAFFIFAMRAVREFEIPVSCDVALMVTADEETGSRKSREAIERAAKASSAVLVLEPGTGLEGKAKTARKGIGDYRITTKGISAHSGVDFEKGASAIVEIARQIGVISSFTNLKTGVTVNPGVISGGTRSNVIAAAASVHVDVRAPRMKDAAALEKKFRALQAFDKRCELQIEGGLNRPPMERTKGVAALFRLARASAAELGVDLQESATGGGSDGNFTAALGIPTLDGIGAVGEGAHAAHESILIDRIPDRVALLTKLVSAIC